MASSCVPCVVIPRAPRAQAEESLDVATSFAAGARAFIDRLALRPGERVLDVASVTGGLTVAAARARDAEVEELPYIDGQFDTTVSMFGAMFSPRPERAGAELVRVTRPGGRVAMANWIADGLIARLLRAHTALVPPPAGVPSPLDWGHAGLVRQRLGSRVISLVATRRTLELRFPLAPEAVSELFATSWAPTVAALRATDAAGARRLRRDLTGLFRDHNIAGDGTTAVVAAYLDVQARIG